MTIKAFRIQPDGNIAIPTAAASLDLITGSLPQGFYTTFSTLAQGTKVLGLQSHLDRLYLPAVEFRVHPAVDETSLRQRIAELVQHNLPHESRVRLILAKDTGGIYVCILQFRPLPEVVFQNGVHVITSAVSRHDPRIKDTTFISESIAQRKLLNKDVFEVLLTKNGRILEGMTSNFYGIVYPVIASDIERQRSDAKQSPTEGQGLLRREEHPPRNDGIIITAQRGVLLGVTRKAVLRIARGQGMFLEYHAPSLEENFDEAFLTSSSRGVVPIVSIDNKPVGQGRVGAWTKTLSKAYQVYVQERSEKIVE